MKIGEAVAVTNMAHEDDCMHEMFVEIKWAGRKLAVPLSQIEAVDADEETQKAIEYWHYWISRGYGCAEVALLVQRLKNLQGRRL